MLALDGFNREDATRTSIEGRAFGGRSSPGYSSVTKPSYILLIPNTVGLESLGLLFTSSLFLEICKGIGETRSKGWLLNAGDAIDIGVFGGNGIGCLGALGERGIGDGNAPIPRGDKGGEANEV